MIIKLFQLGIKCEILILFSTFYWLWCYEEYSVENYSENPYQFLFSVILSPGHFPWFFGSNDCWEKANSETFCLKAFHYSWYNLQSQ